MGEIAYGAKTYWGAFGEAAPQYAEAAPRIAAWQ